VLGCATCLKKYNLNMRRRVSYMAQTPAITTNLFLESREVLRSAQYVTIKNIQEMTAEYVISIHWMKSKGMAPQRRLDIRKLL